MSEERLEFETVTPNTLRTVAPYNEVFDHVRSVLVANGGAIKKDDFASGTLEAAWRYGINAMGLRVTAQFRTISDDQIELNFKGGFADAIDTTGAGRKKAFEIAALLSGVAPSVISMPPRLGDPEVLNNGKRKNVAGLLALFLGGLGAHKFYLGNWGLGIVYLASIFIVPYVSAIIGLIEAVRFFTLGEASFNEKYNYRNVQPFEVIW